MRAELVPQLVGHVVGILVDLLDQGKDRPLAVGKVVARLPDRVGNVPDFVGGHAELGGDALVGAVAVVAPRGAEGLEDDEFLEAPVEAAGAEGLNQEVGDRAAHGRVARQHAHEVREVPEIGLGAVEHIVEIVAGLGAVEGGGSWHGGASQLGLGKGGRRVEESRI